MDPATYRKVQRETGQWQCMYGVEVEQQRVAPLTVLALSLGALFVQLPIVMDPQAVIEIGAIVAEHLTKVIETKLIKGARFNVLGGTYLSSVADCLERMLSALVLGSLRPSFARLRDITRILRTKRTHHAAGHAEQGYRTLAQGGGRQAA